MRLFVLFFLTYFFPFAMFGQQIREHTVANGEKIESIASHYGLSVKDLKEANPGLDDYIFSGMVLKIPLPSQNAFNSSTTETDELSDVIYIKDGSELVAKILNVGTNEIVFEQYDTNEPFSISKSEVVSIKFGNESTSMSPPKKGQRTTKRRKR